MKKTIKNQSMKKSSFLTTGAVMGTLACAILTASCSKTNNSANPGNSNPNNSNPVTTAIRFTNNTPTPVNLYYYGGATVIAVGASFSVSGTAGTVFTASANTFGTIDSSMTYGTSYTTGSQLGDPLNWTISETYPASDTLTFPLNVQPSEFFLKIKNTSSQNIGRIWVNYGISPGQEYFPYLTIPNDGKVHSVGYFPAFTNSNLYLKSSNYTINWSYTLSLPMVNNQVYTYTATN